MLRRGVEEHEAVPGLDGRRCRGERDLGELLGLLAQRVEAVALVVPDEMAGHARLTLTDARPGPGHPGAVGGASFSGSSLPSWTMARLTQVPSSSPCVLGSAPNARASRIDSVL